MKRYLVTLFDDSQAQDREDCYWDLIVHAESASDAESIALTDERVGTYVTAIRLLQESAVQS